MPNLIDGVNITFKCKNENCSMTMTWPVDDLDGIKLLVKYLLDVGTLQCDNCDTDMELVDEN